MRNPFENALEQLRRAERAGSLSAGILERMSQAEREITVSIPVAMDNGTTRLFEGYRVQHSSLRGPYKGGVRFHPRADLNEVRALALWMTIKTAVANIPLGGGKGGITVDPRELTQGELERLSRAWVRTLCPNLGPHVDIPAPDVNTNPEIMSWMADEYANLTGDATNAAFTGKPTASGGSEGRVKATGLGGFLVFDALREALGLPEKARVAIQGIGNVGGIAGLVFSERGHTVIALSDSKGGVYDPSGLDVAAVEEYKVTHGTLRDFPNAGSVTNAELLTLDADVLVPAALENQITGENAQDIRAKAVLELANGPTTPEADDILFARGIPVIPDVLANSGGVIVSYFEWLQNLQGEHWSEKEVEDKMADILTREARHVWERSRKASTDLRRAAFLIALERLQDALPG